MHEIQRFTTKLGKWPQNKSYAHHFALACSKVHMTGLHGKKMHWESGIAND
jgi:hypothetical protein